MIGGESRIAQPGEDSYERDVIGFVNECLEEGDAFLRGQKNYNRISEAQKMIEEARMASGPRGLSSTEANHTAKAAMQLVSAMTDTRNFWEYRTFNRRYEKQTQILGKWSIHLWLNRQWDMRFSDMLRIITYAGTSYGHIRWDGRLQEQVLDAEDPRDVIPIRPGDNHTIQTAFGVLLRRHRTVNYLRRAYFPDDPEKASLIQPDSDGSRANADNTRYQRLVDRLVSPFHAAQVSLKGGTKGPPRIPTAEEFTLYLDDPTLNETKETLYIGDWHLRPVEDCRQCASQGTPHAVNNWSYKVFPGEKKWPNKRLICSTRTMLLYDGPSPYWHGMYPFPKLTLDPWPKLWLGKGLIWPAMPMQSLLNDLLRVLDNHFKKWEKPDLFADKNSVSVSEFRKINTARPGLKMRHNPVAGKGIQLEYPDALPSYFFDSIKFAIEEIGTLSGAQDISQMMRLNQLPSASAVEQIMEKMTPEVRMRSRILEAFTREFATILAYNIAQFKTEAETMTVLGPDAVTPENFDWDPGTFIPDFVHAGDLKNDGMPTSEAMARGPMPRMNRAREFMRQMAMHIAPGSLLSASEIQRKLVYMQMFREGAIDMQTMADILGITNFGTIPGETILEKLQWQMENGLGAAAQQQGPGRPPTGQQPPERQIKSGPNGPRMVTSESG